MSGRRWSGTDQAGLEGLVYAVLGLGVLSVVPRVVAAVRGEPIELSATLPDRLVEPVRGVDGPFTGTIVLDDPSPAQQLVALLPPVLALALGVVGAVLLLRVVRALRDGDPFTPRSARHLTWLAVLVAAGGVGLQLVQDLTRNVLLAGTGALADELGSEFTLPLWPVAAGLLIAFVAEVYTRGSALRDDVEGLV